MEYIKLKLKDKSAQDMVEFSFVLPLLMFCFVFILTGGQLVYNKFVSFDAVYNGLRQAATERQWSALSRMRDVVKTFEPQAISISGSECEIELTGGSWEKNKKITGKVTFHVNTLFPINFSNGLRASNTMDVSSTTIALVEYDKTNNYNGSKTR